MPTRTSARRFDLLEVMLIAALASAAVWVVADQQVEVANKKVADQQVAARQVADKQVPPAMDSDSAAELAALESRYGPARNSEHSEEWIIRDFFSDRQGGFFVDVGANDYKIFSNTFYLETVLGWSGIAVEPQRQFEPDYAAHRPRTRFRPFFVSDQSNQEAKLYVQTANSLVSSANKEFNSRYGNSTRELTVPTITLDDLLASERVEHIDFMTLDIELWEPKALAGFDIERYKPALVCVEAHPDVRQQLLDYFAQHRYRIVGKYLRADTANLYFAPAF